MEFKNTKTALLELDKVEKNFDKACDNLKSNSDLSSLLNKVNEAENDVRRAFYEDSKDRNSLDNCMLVNILWLRERVRDREKLERINKTQIRKDLERLTEPMIDGCYNLSYMDNHYAQSLKSKYGCSIEKLKEMVK